MVELDRADTLKREIQAAVGSARTLDAAARRFAELIRSEYDGLMRVAIRAYDSESNTVRIVGLWSDKDSAIGTGVTTSATATSMPEILRTGRPVFEANAQELYLDGVLRSEGIRSWVSIPLKSGRAVKGLLSLSSSRPNAFPREDEPFLAEVGEVVEEHLLSLGSEW